MPNRRNNRRSTARRQQDQRRLATLYRNKHEETAPDAGKPANQAAPTKGAA